MHAVSKRGIRYLQYMPASDVARPWLLLHADSLPNVQDGSLIDGQSVRWKYQSVSETTIATLISKLCRIPRDSDPTGMHHLEAHQQWRPPQSIPAEQNQWNYRKNYGLGPALPISSAFHHMLWQYFLIQVLSLRSISAEGLFAASNVRHFSMNSHKYIASSLSKPHQL